METTITMHKGNLEFPNLEEFQSTQLRDLYIAFYKTPENVPRSKADLLEALSEVYTDSHFRYLLARLEATQAFRHAYVYSFHADQGKASLRERIGNLDELIEKLTYKSDSACKLKYLGTVPAPYPLLRLVHPVHNIVYIPAGQGLLKKTERISRHPVTVAIKPDLEIVEVRFDGFDQTRDTPAEYKIPYELIAQECRSFVESTLAVTVKGLPLKSAVASLLREYPDEVTQVKNISRVGNGRVSIDTGDSEESDDVSSFLRSAFNLSGPDPIPSRAMDSWIAEHITLRWSEQKIETRLDLTRETPEIYFLWKSSPFKSMATHDKIIRRLLEFADLSYSNMQKKLKSSMKDFGTAIFTPFELSQRAAAPLEEALSYLLEETSKNHLKIRFRVRCDEHLQEVFNNWKSNLADIPKNVTTESQQVINTSDPKNIEIGFANVAEAK
jgi:hypothetical protein